MIWGLDLKKKYVFSPNNAKPPGEKKPDNPHTPLTQRVKFRAFNYGSGLLQRRVRLSLAGVKSQGNSAERVRFRLGISKMTSLSLAMRLNRNVFCLRSLPDRDCSDFRPALEI